MRRLSVAVILAATLGAGTMLSAPAQAAPAGAPGHIGIAADQLNPVENAQYVYRGRRYCWYEGGWNGRGWYLCGSATRRGYGWGGPHGWNAWVWNAPGPGVVVVPRGRYYWNGRYYNERYSRGGRWYYR